ncbi:hypothetical protein CJF31_00004207 [Rutstroemia sp. NJR-2017a BVV2]|nr:hypothetical protein CJF31_00002207 [Rutstroemia sp. NJR-2017a BVV2]PQE09367.1 hypothetical protein CJF31_00004207 [Rutstroemia sp. NJR-2017a BVV2]
MGLFKHRDKSRMEAPRPAPTPQTPIAAPMNPAPAPHSPSHTPGDSNAVLSSNSNNDSFRSSNISSADTRINGHNNQNNHNHHNTANSGVTTTTTTTTTTTITTVNTDGTIHTHSHPYNPHTDPPPASQTTYPANERPPPAAIEGYPQNTQTPIPQERPEPEVRRNSTSGGRVIPERSPLRNSNPIPPLNLDHTDPSSPVYQNPNAATLNSPNSNPNLNPNMANLQQTTSNQETIQPPRMPINGQPQAPPSPGSSSVNFSRPGGKRENLLIAAKGLHGAGEALRGTVNSAIAGGFGDQRDLEKNRMIKEQGMREYTSSGFRERAEGKLRRKSGNVNSVGVGAERV